MPATQTTTMTAATAIRTLATWVWRDASLEGLAPGSLLPAGPPPRGCF